MKEITRSYKKFLSNLKKKINIDKKDLTLDCSLDELFNYFGTDKGSMVNDPYTKGSKKIHGHGFAKFYEKNLKRFKNKSFSMLEIGAWEGASTASFSKFFPMSKIYALDKNFKFKYKSKRIKFFNCNVNNLKHLNEFEKIFKDYKFSIIIDDGSHFLKDMIFSLKFFFKYLDKNGIFVIEDYNSPRYFKELDNSEGKELLINEILKKINEKIVFKSQILNLEDQKILFNNIRRIEVFKGNTPISDIAFLTKQS